MTRRKPILWLAGLLVCSLAVQAKYAIRDVECYTGEDFVQLHFKAKEIIPIPDIFYPQKDNYRFLVMRLSDTAFDVRQNQLTFDSPVVRSLQIVDGRDYVDVEIQLKEKVNYRVFTNRNGVYIEFPMVKEITSASPTPSPTAADPVTRAPDDEADFPEETTIATVPDPGPPAAAGRSVIRDYEMNRDGDRGVTFRFRLDRPVDYEVIPITESPVRLAIDLHGARMRRLMETVNVLNVNTLRGAFNRPTVYRLVFDLDYLKTYDVRFRGNVLEVAFADAAVLADSTRAEITPEPAAADPAPAPSKDTAVPAADTPLDTEVPPITMVTPVEEKAPQVQTDPAPDNELTSSQSQAVNPVSDGGEFFSKEKSQVGQDHFQTSYLEEGGGQAPLIETDKTITEGQRKYTGDLMDFNFKNADLSNVLLFFAKIAGLNILIDPGVTGKVTATMFQVPWDQALEYFLKVNGLDMVQEGNILRIGEVGKLASEAEKRRKLKEARELEGDLEVWPVSLSYAQVEKVKPILEKYLTQRGEIVTDQRTNQMIITDVPWKRPTIDKLIETLDLPTRQVSIEARIVESSTNYTQNLGIQWGFNMIADAAYGNQTSLAFPNSVLIDGNAIVDPNAPGLQNPNTLNGYAINLPAPVFNSGLGVSLGNVANTFRLDAAITAMQKNGKGRIISAPKTTTQNNQSASIMQGRQIPVQTIQNNTVTTRYVPAALELEVTPQITADGTIITQLKITNNSADFANLVQGIPPIITQEIETTVMVKDGGTIVIGGLYRVEDNKTTDSVPLLSKIPLLGNLFKNSQKQSAQKELLIFITPRIIK